MARDNTNDPTPFAVLCNCIQTDGTGDELPVFLTRTEFITQLRNPDFPWKCPRCGCCAEWDDECQETNPQGTLHG